MSESYPEKRTGSDDLAQNRSQNHSNPTSAPKAKKRPANERKANERRKPRSAKAVEQGDKAQSGEAPHGETPDADFNYYFSIGDAHGSPESLRALVSLCSTSSRHKFCEDQMRPIYNLQHLHYDGPADIAIMRTLPLFQDLGSKQLRQMADVLQSFWAPVGTNILTVNETGRYVYVLVEGTVKIFLRRPGRSDVILALLGEGEVLGEIGGVDGQRPSADVLTLEDSHFFAMPREELWNCMQHVPQLGCNVSLIMARRLRQATGQIQALATLDVYGRVARQLLAFSEAYGRKTDEGTLIPMRLKQHDLADLIAASRVRVNQVMMHFREENLVTLDEKKRVVVLNREGLEAQCRVRHAPREKSEPEENEPSEEGAGE
jgi:CRP/FNR family transcriptional regulator, cyclic AMP receptor protein